MVMPALLNLPSEDDYRAHFVATYCQGPISTFDGIFVRFQRRQFDHCCYESERRTGRKTYFSRQRAERLNWIKAALQDPNADLRVGWDKSRRCYDYDRRVAIVSGNYIVIISLQQNQRTARFITAYVADTGRTLRLIKTSPEWPR